MKNDIRQLKKYQWKSIWAGGWTLLPISDFGEHYVSTLSIGGRPFVSKVVFLYKNGKSSAWITEEDIAKFHSVLLKLVDGKIARVRQFASQTILSANNAMRFMANNQHAITPKIFREYLEIIRAYYFSHMPIKYLADALTEEQLQKFLPILEKARIAAEPVFTQTIQYDRAVAKAVNKATKIPTAKLLDLTKDELLTVWKKGAKLPKNISARHSFCALVFFEKKPSLVLGSQAKEIEAIVRHVDMQQEIIGKSAFPGKVTGRVKVVLDPSNVSDFKSGDILVAQMTRPEYLALMKKSGACVTDAGGVLSHAAISARELKKPCVIGTKVATQLLKDGDKVEVDANKGIVRKI